MNVYIWQLIIQVLKLHKIFFFYFFVVIEEEKKEKENGGFITDEPKKINTNGVHKDVSSKNLNKIL